MLIEWSIYANATVVCYWLRCMLLPECCRKSNGLTKSSSLIFMLRRWVICDWSQYQVDWWLWMIKPYHNVWKCEWILIFSSFGFFRKGFKPLHSADCDPIRRENITANNKLKILKYNFTWKLNSIVAVLNTLLNKTIA